MLLCCDACLTSLVLLNLYCFKIESDSECSPLAFVATVLLYPGAIIFSPLFGLLSVSCGVSALCKQYAILVVLSMINYLVALLLLVIFPHSVSYSTLFLVVTMLICKVLQLEIVGHFIAQAEACEGKSWTELYQYRRGALPALSI